MAGINSTVDPLVPYYSQFQADTYVINYAKIGSGHTPIFAFTGVMAPLWASFAPLVGLMLKDPMFCATYTFFGWDWPGYFGSNPPRRRLEDISFGTDVELAHALLTNLTSTKFVIIGYSGGSQTALQFSIKYPNLVQKLVIVGGWDRLEENKSYPNFTDIPQRVILMFENEFNGSRESMLEHWTSWHSAILAQYAHIDRSSWEKRYKHFKIPTLIIWGTQDVLVSFKQTMDLHNLIKTSRLKIFPHSEHNVLYQFPEKFFRLLISFIEKNNENNEESTTVRHN